MIENNESIQSVRIKTYEKGDMDNEENTQDVRIKTYDKDCNTKRRRRVKGGEHARKANYRPFASSNPRERSACPKCNSVNIVKKNRAHLYLCHRCGWKGEGVVKIIY